MTWQTIPEWPSQHILHAHNIFVSQEQLAKIRGVYKSYIYPFLIMWKWVLWIHIFFLASLAYLHLKYWRKTKMWELRRWREKELKNHQHSRVFLSPLEVRLPLYGYADGTRTRSHSDLCSSRKNTHRTICTLLGIWFHNLWLKQGVAKGLAVSCRHDNVKKDEI